MMKRFIVACMVFLAGCGPSAEVELGDTNAERGGPAISKKPLGNLFIIGGGSRPASIMEGMAQQVTSPGAYVLVFPQSSAEPDSAFFYLERDLRPHVEMPIVNVGNAYLRTSLIDSVRQASLIFITGGDQNRFLKSVHPGVSKAIKAAYEKGATVGGTSAGAALMSSIMITGDQRDWPVYEPTYSTLNLGNGIYDQGLGLLDSVVVDQHFVVRSRYNRLISALADTGFPYAIGVDESTAFVVTPDYCTVLGESQVVLMHRPEKFHGPNGKIGLAHLRMDIYLQGDTFNLNLWK